MLKTSICSASLFIAPDDKKKAEAALVKILSKYGRYSKENPSEHRLCVTIEGASFDDIQNDLLGPLRKFLDPSKRSLISFVGSGRVNTISISDGEVHCA